MTEEASSSAAVTEAVHIQGEPAAGNWSRRWIEWFSQVGEGRTRAASKGGDISAMLDVVVGKSRRIILRQTCKSVGVRGGGGHWLGLGGASQTPIGCRRAVAHCVWLAA